MSKPDIGRVGIWTFHLDLMPSTQAQETVSELDELGYGAVWIPEAVGKEALTHSAVLLAGSQSITVATGIASMYARDPMSMNAAHQTLEEAYPGRFLLGIGVSHEHFVARVRGHDYSKPYTAMKNYLDAMDSSIFLAKGPTTKPRRVLAALRPRMLELAREKADGAHPYFVPPEHTAKAREILGPDKLLAVEQAVILETDPIKAREIARTHTHLYVPLPNYRNNLLSLGGFDEDDFPDNGSDKLVDAIVAWGTIDDVIARVQAHHDAGADHVCVQVLSAKTTDAPRDEWRELAPALLA